MNPRLVRTLVAIVLFCSVAPARAAVPREVRTEYSLASWSTKDGLPSNIVSAIAQDALGYLWLGTDAGLVRFDGVRFVSWKGSGGVPLPTTSIRALLVTRDGGLWIGYGGTGSLARLDHGGGVRLFGANDGLVNGSVTALAEDFDGGVWAVSGGSLYRFDRNRWHLVTAQDGLSDGQVGGIFVDRAGTIFVGATSGVFQRLPGHDRFEPVGALREVARAVSSNTAGEVWVTDPVFGFKLLGAEAPADRDTRQGRGARLLHDRVGNLWVATVGQGLWRVPREWAHDREANKRAIQLQGLLSPGIRCLFEDHDGNIWVGTAEGLNRLTESRVTPITDVGLVTGVESTGDGGVWVAASDQLLRFADTSGEWRGQRQEIGTERIRAFHADKDATWVATNAGLMRIAGGRQTMVPLPSSAQATRISSLSPDGRGGVWFFGIDRKLFHWTEGHLESFEADSDLTRSPVSSMYVDRNGRVWVASLSGQLSRVDVSGEVQSFTRQDGLGTGPYTAFFEDRSNVLWFGGSDGLTRFRDGRFDAVSAENGFPSSVLAVVEDDDGYLWLGTSIGIVRLDPKEFDKAAHDRSYRLQYRLYDAADGLAGCPIWQGSNNAVRASDGRLWFLTSKGLTVINPRSFATHRRTPSVLIENVALDDEQVAPAEGYRLPPGVTRLQIDYTAIDLSSPQKVHFRYRLDGFDSDWIDAGGRRQAVYTNLPPRTYHFRVAASNSDGSWTEAGAGWNFELMPMMYQTTWFRLLVLVGAALAIWGAWAFRLRQMQRHFSSLLGERVRLSREIHDTLLQSLVGVSLQFDAAANWEDAPLDLRNQLLAIRHQVDDYIREARHSIWNLRSPLLESRPLHDALRETAQRATTGAGIAFDFSVRGTPFGCARQVEEQVLRIGQEAVLNAVRHAGARSIAMVLTYREDSLHLQVTDDGCGFEAHEVPATPVGHYGLASMKERAEEVGGVFRLRSARGTGTTIETTIPTAQEV